MAGMDESIICFVCKEIIEDDDDCMILTCYEHVACGACLQLVNIKCSICTETKEEPAQKQEPTTNTKKRNVIDLSEETDSDDDFVLKRV